MPATGAAAARRRPVALVRRPARGRAGELHRAAGRDPRHHRPERRRQDDAVQRAERRAAADEGTATLDGQPMLGPQGAPGLPHGRRPHLPGGAQLPAPAAARQRGGRRLRRGAAGPRGGRARRRRRCTASACASPGTAAGRPAYQQAAAADGAGARAGRPSAPAAARRDAGRASAARSATRCWTCCSGCATRA